MTKKEIQLKVGEIPSNAQSDIGVGIVRFDTRLMNELDIHEGDVVEIEGKKKTGAVALRPYPADISLNIVRMDGYLRRNAGTSIGEKVTVKPAEVSEAKKITLAPAEKGVILQVPPEHAKRALMNRIATKGDIIAPITRRQRMSFGEFFDFDEMFSLGFSETKFTVVNTNPKGITKITDMTQVEVLPQAVEVKEEGKLPVITYEDIGGLREEVKKVREMIELPLRHPELFERLGVEPPKGILLFGPPGTGKTLLARVVANEAGVNFIALNGPEITSKWYGESEKKIRELFKNAEEGAPSIIFIDEIDAIAPKREEVTGEVERRMVAQLLASMDGLKSRGQVIVIAASNRENAIDPALRRPGRFDREIEIGVPDRQGRKEVLQIHTRNMPLDDHNKKVSKKVSISKMADITHGFVGADLSALCKEAAMSALRRILPNINLKEKIIDPKLIETLDVNMEDFRNALRFVEPSAMREVLVEIPKITWNDVGGLEDVKQNLREMVEWPLKHPEAFKRMGIKPPRGILLYGVPGNGKTLLARAVANESEANFIAIKGPELFSKWLGESEKHIREMFKRARQVSPAIIFLDEIDALAPKRGHADSGVSDRVVTQLLSEMDGLEGIEGIVIIGATNRPDVIDTALLRHGRFDRHIYIPVPDIESRKKIFKVHTKEMPLALANEYLFCWDKISRNDNEKLIKFLKEKFKIEWVKTAKIKKNEDGKTISVSTEENSISLKLNDEKTNVRIEIDDHNVTEFTARTENGKLNIYRDEEEDLDRRFKDEPTEDEAIDREKSKILSKMAADEVVNPQDMDKPFKKKKENKKKKDIKFEDMSPKEKLLYYLTKETENYVGADIEGLCKEAAILALRENINAKEITAKHFDEALKIIKPSVSKEEVDNFKKRAGKTKKLHPEAEEFGYVG